MKEIKTISVKCDTKDTLNIAEMTELQGNLKARNDVDYDKIKLSIVKYGFSFPFFVWKSDKNYILDGHGRFETLCRMQKDGYLIPDVPVVFVEAKDLKEAKQKLLRLNSQYGKMTKESVLEFAEDIDLNFDEIALPDTVIDFSDQSEEPAETEGDDETPEVDEKSEPVSKRGEMYELGNSILMCGDSTNAEDVARLMGGEKASLVLTDPPYGISVVGENGKVGEDNLAKNGIYMPVKGDETTKTTEDFIKVCKELGYEKQIIFGGNYFIQFLPFSDSWLIWDKRGDMASNNFADGEMAWCSFHTPVRIYKQVWSGMIKEGEHGKRVHPTQKTVKMLADILKDFSAENELVFDGFGGSGSVLIACEQTGRRCRMIEYEPYYCDIIRKRYTIWCKENNKPLTSGCLADD